MLLFTSITRATSQKISWSWARYKRNNQMEVQLKLCEVQTRLSNEKGNQPIWKTVLILIRQNILVFKTTESQHSGPGVLAERIWTKKKLRLEVYNRPPNRTEWKHHP